MQGDDHAVDVLDFAELSFWTLEPGREEANMEGQADSGEGEGQYKWSNWEAIGQLRSRWLLEGWTG